MEKQQQPIESDSLYDNNAIEPNDIDETYCIISAPFIYVNCNEHSQLNDSEDEIVPNLRAIKYDDLMQLMPIAVKVLTCTNNDETIDMCRLLTSKIIESTSDEHVKTFMMFLEFISTMSKSMAIEDDYVDVTQEMLSFDIIREYKCDPITKILQSAEPIVFNDNAITNNSYKLYSQIPSDVAAQTIAHIRRQTNDTDFNRAQLYLSYFEKVLQLRNGYIPNSSVIVTNLATFYLTLYTKSYPIRGHCLSNLKSNMLGYMCDLVIRSRLIQAWQRDSCLQKLLMDIIKNYDNKHHSVHICKLTSAKLRAKYILNLLAKSPELCDFSKHLNYEVYENILEKFKITINNKWYYVFDSDFLIGLATKFPELESLRDKFANYTDNMSQEEFAMMDPKLREMFKSI